MRLVAERIAATLSLAEELSQVSRPRRSHLDELKLLIEEEGESFAKSTQAAQNSNNEAYRKSMTSASRNSSAIIMLLKQALNALRDKDVETAVDVLGQVVDYRASKKESKRVVNVAKLYLQYETETNSEFHDWLKQKGHNEALIELGVPSARTTKKPTRASSNRPEDY